VQSICTKSLSRQLCKVDVIIISNFKEREAEIEIEDLGEVMPKARKERNIDSNSGISVHRTLLFRLKAVSPM
jgi:hypothetical protein